MHLLLLTGVRLVYLGNLALLLIGASFAVDEAGPEDSDLGIATLKDVEQIVAIFLPHTVRCRPLTLASAIGHLRWFRERPGRHGGSGVTRGRDFWAIRGGE